MTVRQAHREIRLQVGRIPFLVCAPYFHASLAGFSGADFRDGAPSVLNPLLASGEIDCAPSSSFEYARNPDRYLLLPGLCTSGRGEVKSVLLFSKEPWESLEKKPVSLSPDSATSNALFRVLSRFHFKVDPECLEAGEERGASPVARVAIGDAALRESQAGRWPYRYDLANVWKSWKNAPLPFGLWMVRIDAWQSKREVILRYHEHLRASLSSFFTDPEGALTAWSRVYPLPLPWEKALAFFPAADYELKPEHERALLDFYGHCQELRIAVRDAGTPLRSGLIRV